MADEHETTTEPETDTGDTEPQPETGGGDTGEPTPDGGAPSATDPSSDDGEEDWKAKADLYKAQMRKQEQRAKANHDENQRLQTELAQLRKQAETQAAKAKDPDRTSEQRHTDQGQADATSEQIAQLATVIEQLQADQAAIKQAAEQAERDKLIAEVAADKGLTAVQARRLTGASREELEADADEVIAAFGLGKTTEPKAPAKPREKRPTRSGSANESGREISREEMLALVTDTRRGARRA